jgi:hypothetical protein
LQIDIDGPFFALKIFIVTYVKFYGLSFEQVLRLGKNESGPGRTYTAISNLKGNFGREKFSKKNILVFKKSFLKFCISHLCSYTNIIVDLEVDLSPGYDPYYSDIRHHVYHIQFKPFLDCLWG